MNEWLTDWMNERMTDWLNERMTDWLNERMTDWLNERMTDWLSERMNEWTNDWLTEWTNERMNEWMNEWMNENTAIVQCYTVAIQQCSRAKEWLWLNLYSISQENAFNDFYRLNNCRSNTKWRQGILNVIQTETIITLILGYTHCWVFKQFEMNDGSHFLRD